MKEDKLWDQIYVAEQVLIDFYKPDIITFGDDKPTDYYDYLRGNIRAVQLPRIGDGISSREIVSKVSNEVKGNTEQFYRPGTV